MKEMSLSVRPLGSRLGAGLQERGVWEVRVKLRVIAAFNSRQPALSVRVTGVGRGPRRRFYRPLYKEGDGNFDLPWFLLPIEAEDETMAKSDCP
jgi:hypothetical protein